MPAETNNNPALNSEQPKVAVRQPPSSPSAWSGIIFPRILHPVAQGIAMVAVCSLVISLKNSMFGKILAPALFKTAVQITGNLLGMISPALIPFAPAVAIGLPLSLLGIQLILSGIEMARKYQGFLISLQSDTAYALFSWLVPAALCAALFVNGFTPFAAYSATFGITFLCSTPWLWGFPCWQQQAEYEQAKKDFENKQKEDDKARDNQAKKELEKQQKEDAAARAQANASGLNASNQSSADQSSAGVPTQFSNASSSSTSAVPPQNNQEDAARAQNTNGGSPTPMFNHSQQTAQNLQELAQPTQSPAAPVAPQPPTNTTLAP